MSDTPETDQCVKENKHIKFLEEDHWSLSGKFTYTHPIVCLSRKMERERDEAVRSCHIWQKGHAELVAERDKYLEQADYFIKRLSRTQERMYDAERKIKKISEALKYILGIGLTQKTKAKAEKALQTNEWRNSLAPSACTLDWDSGPYPNTMRIVLATDGENIYTATYTKEDGWQDAYSGEPIDYYLTYWCEIPYFPQL